MSKGSSQTCKNESSARKELVIFEKGPLPPKKLKGGVKSFKNGTPLREVIREVQFDWPFCSAFFGQWPLCEPSQNPERRKMKPHN